MVHKFREGLREQSRDDFLTLKIQIKNLSSQIKLDYTAWKYSAFLTDENNNSYKLIRPDSFGAWFVRSYGTKAATAIYPQTEYEEMLLFEKPVAAARYLLLVLPSANIRESGNLQFRIPATMVLTKAEKENSKWLKEGKWLR